MRIHADRLDAESLHHVLIGLLQRDQLDPAVFLLRTDEAGSRSRTRSINVRLASRSHCTPEGKARRRMNTGNRGASGGYAATYDEWGIFIAALFRVEPTAIIGQYDGASNFTAQTGGAYQGEYVIAEVP